MINEKHIEILREIINIGVGRAANLLNTIVNKHITLNVPFMRIAKIENLVDDLDSPGSTNYSLVNMNFSGHISGKANLLFTSVDATLLVNTFMEQQDLGSDIESMKSGVLSEIGNIVMNSLIGTISNYVKQNMEYSVPAYKEGELKDLMMINYTDYEDSVIVVHTKFKIEELNVMGDFILLLELGSMKNLIDKITSLEDNIFES